MGKGDLGKGDLGERKEGVREKKFVLWDNDLSVLKEKEKKESYVYMFTNVYLNRYCTSVFFTSHFISFQRNFNFCYCQNFDG